MLLGILIGPIVPDSRGGRFGLFLCIGYSSLMLQLIDQDLEVDSVRRLAVRRMTAIFTHN